MQSGRLWASLCVSAVMVAALVTGVYSVMTEPTLTNIVAATRTTESSTYSERTYLYTVTGLTVTTVGTVTSRFTSVSYRCGSGYEFYASIELWQFYVEHGAYGESYCGHAHHYGEQGVLERCKNQFSIQLS